MSGKKKRRSAAAAKKNGRILIIGCVLLAAIIAAAAILYFVKPGLYHEYLGIGEHSFGEWRTERAADCSSSGERVRTCKYCDETQREVIPPTGEHSFDGEGICSVCGFDREFNGASEAAEESEFSVHVINLGDKAGDCIYIKAGETDVLIDAGSEASSAQLICDYLSPRVDDGKLEYVIATHADRDHIAAFAGRTSGGTGTGVLYKYDVGTLIRFDNVEEEKAGKENDTSTDYGKFCAAVKYAQNKGAAVYTGSQCYDETDGAQRTYVLNESPVIRMSVLYNYYYYNVSADENNHSVVTLFTVETSSGEKNFLFTGDLEASGEKKLAEYYSNPSNSKSEYDVLPESDFYKAGHHGSKTSSSTQLMDMVKPKYVAVSCCAFAPQYTTANDNTFPCLDSLANIMKYTDKIYVTAVADTLPALDYNDKGELEFANKKYTGKPLNGDIVFYLRETGGAGEEKTYSLNLYCSSGDFTPFPETPQFAQYRPSLSAL